MSSSMPTSTPMAVHDGRAPLTHGMADVEPGVRIHYVLAGEGSRTVVLLHGFPETWREWQAVIPLLAGAGFRVVAADYRGAGDSRDPAAAMTSSGWPRMSTASCRVIWGSPIRW
jgi:pimeloyl-ACP methyl ester carboxylesterase